MATTTKLDPHEPAMLRAMAHQLRRTDPAKSAELLAKAKAADDALSAEARDRIRAACLKFVSGGFPAVTSADVAVIDEGRSTGTVSLKRLGGDQAKLAIFRFLERPPA